MGLTRIKGITGRSTQLIGMILRKGLLTSGLILQATLFSFAQDNVGIGTTNPQAQAILELVSPNQGFLMTRMNATDTSIAGLNQQGMMFFAQDVQAFLYFDGTSWQSVASGVNYWGENGANIFNLNTGNVGIGTNTPLGKLEVQDPTPGTGNGAFNSFQGAGLGAAVYSSSSSGSDNTGTIFAVGRLAGVETHGHGLSNFGVWGHQTGLGSGGWGVFASNGASFSAPDRYVGLAGSSGFPYAGVFMGGNVGIGTTTPTEVLDIAGSEGNVEFHPYFSDPTHKTSLMSTLIANTDAGPQLRFQRSDLLYTDIGMDSIGNFVVEDEFDERILVLEQSGNLGIGTVDPEYKFDVQGEFNGIARIRANNGWAWLYIDKTSSTDNAWIGFRQGNLDRWVMGDYNTGGAEDFRLIDWSNGGAANYAFWLERTTNSLGLGTNTPVNRLDVEGSMAVGATYSGADAAPANGLIVEGNVGIGTNAPGARLEVRASSPGNGFGVTESHHDSNFGYAFLGSNSSGGDNTGTIYTRARIAGIEANPTGSNNAGVWGHQFNVGAGGWGVIASNGASETSPDRYAALAGSSAFPYAGVFMGGNVGIGTATPGDLLDVNGNVNISNTGRLSFGGIDVLNTVSNGSNVYANIRVIRNLSSSLQDGMYINYNSTGGTAADLRFYSGSTVERMRVDATSGYVGVNASNPITQFHVNHTTGITNGVSLSNASGGSDRWHYYVFTTDNMTLYFNNALRGTFNSVSGAYTAASDVKFKKEINDLDNPLDKINQLRPVEYRFKHQKESDRTKYIGFIAQEVEPLYPSLVTHTNPEGAEEGVDELTLDYSGFGVLAIKAIQEQQKIIEKLKADLEETQRRLTELEDK